MAELRSPAARAHTQRHTEPKKLGLIVRGDLDRMVMKALEKDRARRYESASGFAIDIQRYVDHEPVVASPPSAGYRLRTFNRRNRAVVTAGTLVSAVLVLGVIGRSWGLGGRSKSGNCPARPRPR